MTRTRIDQQEHGYRSGHQLLSASRKLPREDQDLVDRLSDMAGQLRPGETFKSYLTTYPLPSSGDYVVARTWQDLETPRAGCVRTRSLLVPMTIWESMDGISQLLPLLTPVDLVEKAEPLELPAESRIPPLVSDTRTIELVEALFFETRQPIVFFETSEAEAIIERVFSALWPRLKRTFAACTFALAPRKMTDRDFDLVFAPKSARTRFSDWSGRRIESGNPQKPRHRWSLSIADRIFRSDEPSLSAHDSLGVLAADTQGDEAALRLSLLWNELSAKAETMPTAVLGMLDILNSQKDSSSRAYDRLAPMIAHAAHLAAISLDEPDGWRFLSALVGKLSTRSVPIPYLDTIEVASAELAGRNTAAALEFLELESASSRSVPDPILAGLGNGVAAGAMDPDALLRLSHISSDIGLSLIASSGPFARRAVAETKRSPHSWLPTMIRFLGSPDRELMKNARRHLGPLFDDAVLSPLLPPLLEGISATELAEFSVQVGRTTKLDIAAFDEPIGNAAKDTASLLALRDAIMDNFKGDGVERFLFSTLNFDPADVAWLDERCPDRALALHLLLKLLAAASDRSLLALQRDTQTRDRMFSMLLEDVPRNIQQIARLLTVSELPIDPALEISSRILPSMGLDEGEGLTRHLVGRAFVEAKADDTRVAALVAYPGLKLAPNQIIQMATSRQADGARVGSNVMLLAAGPPTIRAGIVAHVDDLSERLVERGRENLGAAGYKAWSELILDAGRVDRQVQLRACMQVLAFTFQMLKAPVSTLTRVTFPIVYAQLLQSTGDEDFRRIPALLALPLSFFIDWDRAKSARHELVDAFVDSSWPPSDLLLTAIDAGIDEEVLGYLCRNSRGYAYLSAIERHSRELDVSARSAIENSISSFAANRH